MRTSFRFPLFLEPDGDPAGNGVPAAPAAPAAPAPPAAPPSVMDRPPATGAEPLDLEASLQQFIRHPSATQPRDEEGRFAERQGGGAPARDGQPGAEGATEAVADPAAPASVETPTGEPDNRPEGDDAGTEPGTEGTDDAAAEALRVALPGRQPTDPDVEIEVTDPEVAERLRQLRNGFMRGEDVRQAQRENTEARTEIAALQDQIQTDPAGFVADQLAPEIRVEVALQLLADPGLLEQIAPEVDALLDPERAEMVRAKLETRRYQLKETLRQHADERRHVQAQVQQIRAAVEALIPEDWDAERIALFTNDCMADLGRWVKKVGVSAVDAADIPVALAQRLRAVGLDPVQSAARMTERLASSPPATGAGAPARPSAARTGTGSPAPRRPVATARPVRQPTGAELVAGRDRRQTAAQGAPAGAVAPAASGLHDLPPDADIEDVFDHLRRTP